MPELPEVETVRRGLLPLVGSTIVAAVVFRDRSVRRHDGGAAAFEAQAPGLAIEAVVRRGKFLWFMLGQGDLALLAHLGMSGQLRRWDTPPEPHPHLRVRLNLQEANSQRQHTLDFIDQRTFGHLAIVETKTTTDGFPGGTGADQPVVPLPAAHIGRDVLDPHLDKQQIVAKIKLKNSEIKRILLDQTIVSGIGNIYADEALWRSKVHPQTPAPRLSKRKIEEIIDNAKVIIEDSLKFGGTSFDAQYVDVNGASGQFSDRLAVYGQEGAPCPRCGAAIERITFMNRSSHLCPTCQKR